jgi:cytochrome c peroxidase
MPVRHTVRSLWGVLFLVLLGGGLLIAGRVAGPEDARMLFRRPPQLSTAAEPSDDPVWRLGSRLFFDGQLSQSRQHSCVSCHQPATAWSEPRPRGIDDTGQALALKTPTLLNAGTLERLGWTGRFPDIAAVALFAITSPTMGLPPGELVGRLEADATYATAFRDAFGSTGVTCAKAVTALARYVASITSAKAPFDAWVEGDADAISPSAVRGFAIFTGKGRCDECHSGWAFTDGSYHDIGTTKTDPGRGKSFPTSVELQHAFKTPSLRSVADRAPYMHDGSFATLEDVIDLYDRGGIQRPSRAPTIGPLHLTAQDKADLKAFLLTLSSGTEFHLPRS